MRNIQAKISDFRKSHDQYEKPAEDIINKIFEYGENYQSIVNTRTLAEVGLFSLTNTTNVDKLMCQLLYVNSKLNFEAASHVKEKNVDYINNYKLNNKK